MVHCALLPLLPTSGGLLAAAAPLRRRQPEAIHQLDATPKNVTFPAWACRTIASWGRSVSMRASSKMTSRLGVDLLGIER
jgi:hypothetical protein